MDNVNFACGHCGKLMAVGAQFLGQQVRCPHCQQVVLAPAAVQPAPAPPDPQPEPVIAAASGPPTMTPDDALQTRISMPGVSEMESIFASPESDSDALFGPAPQGLVEMPTEVVLPPPGSPAGSIPSASPTDTTWSYNPAEARRPAPAADATTEQEAAAFSLGPTAAAGEPITTIVDSNALAEAIPRPQIRPPTDRGGWLIALLVVPLISYSILATIAVIYLKFFQAPPSHPHPLEMIPDLEGENPGAKLVKKKVTVDFHRRQEREVPSNLRTKLTEPIRIGDLEVTPLSVEWRHIEFIIPGRNPERSDTECLVLNLQLRNVSKDVAFCPLDPYFVRYWEYIPREGKAGMPFTYLTVGKDHFYGGPITLEEREERHESIRDQLLERVLQPGDEMRTFICTNLDDAVRQAVEKTSQPMLWRVQLRRGFVQTPNRGEVSASAVVGVEFTREDIGHGG